jgi:hypothetical protein
MVPGGQQVRQFFAGRAAGADPVPIILDSGDAARVAALHPQGALFVGMRFEHEGRVWEITHAKDDLRGWVAHPVPFRAE